jgi:septal ring factor EnvC (AmiA/AmiB activator)
MQTTTSDGSNFLRLEFADFLDLQTRLILLPRVEEEGLGAVISSYKKSSCEDTKSQDTAEPSREHRDDTTTLGSVLVGLESKQEDWRDKDFTAILANIREEAPITLVFAAATPKKPTNQEIMVDSTPKPKEGDSIQSGMSALSAWGSRVRAQSGKLAADAATSAAAMANAAKELRARQLQQQQQEQEQQKSALLEKPCNVFLQTSVGAFIPAASAQKVTTSSLLLVRKSATESCPPRGFSYQWYRSPCCRTLALDNGDAASIEGDPEDVEWVTLEGATHAAFQPDATLVGRRLRCIITILPPDHESDDDGSDLDDVDLNSVDPEVQVCDLPEAITADLNLFNGARQALARGAKFGGLAGRGNAAGRTFRVEVSLGQKKRNRQRVTVSSVQIYQVQGDECVPLTEKPLLQVSALANPASPKQFELLLPVVAGDSMFSALCTTDGKLQLEAPNRLTRESFLLALGIANYPGKPADLEAKTILYREEPAVRNLMDDDSLSSATLSCASSVQSSSRSVSSVPPLSPSASAAAASPPPSPQTPPPPGENEDRVTVLERELEFLRSKLARKDKIVSELQRQITRSDASHEQTKQSLSNCQRDWKQSKGDSQNATQSLQAAEKKIQSHDASVLRLQGDHAVQISSLDNRIHAQSSKIAELEKANRTLQNEKAVLSAAVEARESKLVKMGELQTSFAQLSQKVAQGDALRVELEESNKRCQGIQEDLQQVQELEQQWKSELEQANITVEHLSSRIQAQEEGAVSVHSQLDTLQKKNQQLKGERNNYKQKNDSLSKEISRLCRNGRAMKDIEKVMADHQALLKEVEALRKQ